MQEQPDESVTWLNDTAAAFQGRCFQDELIEMTRADERWVKHKATSTSADIPQL